MPFSKRKAYMLIAVAQNLEGIDAQTFAELPHGWTALYFLSKLGLTSILVLIREGRIHPRLSLEESKALLEEFKATPQGNGPGSQSDQRFSRFLAYVRARMAS